MNNNSKIIYNLYIVILILLCFCSLFLFLGDTLFNTRGEPREAIVAYSMLEHGNWILPINNGDEIAFKPPFLHWCIAAFSMLSGTVTEFTSRFPSAFSTLLMIIIGFTFYSHRRNTEVAVLMGLITLTNFEVHRAAYACRVDMLLSAMMVLAIYALYRWIENDRKGVPWGALALMACAALTKGPVGALLPCGIAGTFLLLRGHNFFKLVSQFLLLAIMSLIPLFIWYYLAYLQPHGGDRFLRLIYEENILRFTGGMTYTSHLNPWYYNIQTVVLGFLPYTLVPLMALPFCWKYIKQAFNVQSLKNFFTFKTFKNMDDIELYSLLSILVIFVFYCIPASKRSVYLLPIYPFIAYFIAKLFIWIRKEHFSLLTSFGHIMGILSLILITVFILIRTGNIPENIFEGKHAIENIAYMNALRTAPLSLSTYLIISLPLVTTLYYWIRLYKSNNEDNRQTVLFQIIFIIFSIFFALDGFYQPTILNKKSDKNIAEQIANSVEEGTLYSYRSEYVEANRMHPFTINFYLNDRVIPIDKADKNVKEGHIIFSGNPIEKFAKEFPQYEMNLVFKSDKRSCDDRAPVSFYHFKMKE